jgi:hypothetical protein
MFGARPCRRVTSDTDIPGAYVFWTIATFSCADRCRRRWTGQGQITEVTNLGQQIYQPSMTAVHQVRRWPVRLDSAAVPPIHSHVGDAGAQESKTTDRGMGVIYSKSGFSRLLARAHDCARRAFRARRGQSAVRRSLSWERDMVTSASSED